MDYGVVAAMRPAKDNSTTNVDKEMVMSSATPSYNKSSVKAVVETRILPGAHRQCVLRIVRCYYR